MVKSCANKITSFLITNKTIKNEESELYISKKYIRKYKWIFRKQTIIVIAHRLSTIKNADKIYVMDKGKVIEEGKYI